MSVAVELYQAFLDRSSDALTGAQYGRLAEMMVYPHTIEALDGDLEMDTPAKFAEAGQDFHAYLKRMGMRDYCRICKSAAFEAGAADRITGIHETYILQGGAYAVEPYLIEMQLVRDGGIWRGAGIRARVTNIDVPILSPKQLRERALAAQRDLPKD